MKTNLHSYLRRGVVCLLLVCACCALAQNKRPITHKDYDGWQNIQNQALSPDGKFVAYGLFPQEGDGVGVVRNLQTGAEWREAAGAKPEPPKPNFAATEDEPPRMPRIIIAFTPDNKWVVFSTFP